MDLRNRGDCRFILFNGEGDLLSDAPFTHECAIDKPGLLEIICPYTFLRRSLASPSMLVFRVGTKVLSTIVVGSTVFASGRGHHIHPR